MNMFSRYLPLSCIFLGALILSPASLAEEAVVDVNVKGSWMAPPALGQLGYVQETYTFREDGTFSRKADFKSFCGVGAIKPDCVFYWMTAEGHYTLKGNMMQLRIERGNAVLLQDGQTTPQVRDMEVRPITEDMTLGIDQGNLVFTNKKGGKQTFSPVPSSD